MKKLIALLLVVMMLGSTVAFADTNASIAPYAPEDYKTDGSVLDTPKTELWLQVDATGQIDVTVPLVLVFKTDIDGGKATSPDTYMFTNHSSADLVVTTIVTTDGDKTDDKPTTLELVAYDDTTTLLEDQYMVKLSVPADVDLGTGASTTGWDLDTTPHTNDKANGGLFELKKAAANAGEAGTTTQVIVDMSTGPLSFITKRTTDAAGNDTGMDTTMGVHLLTVTYTVAIDTSDTVGSDITDDPNPATGTTGITDTAAQTFTPTT